MIISNTALGDVILSTPAILSLRKSFPHLKLTLIFKKNIHNFFNEYECVDKVISFDKSFIKVISFDKSFIGLIKHVVFIRKNKIDTIFFLHSNGPQDLFLALLSGSENILKAVENLLKLFPKG